MRRRRTVAVAGLVAALGAAAAGAQGSVWGRSLPAGASPALPFGIGLTIGEQVQDLALDRLTIAGFGAPETAGFVADHRIRDLTARFDAWLLPYLDAFVLVGRIDGRTAIDVGALELPFPFRRLSIDYDGAVYGGGIVLAAGTERLFASLTPVWTRTDLSGDFDSEVETLAVSPRVGLRDGRGSVWLGARWQDVDERHAAPLLIPGAGGVPVRLELAERSAWDGLAGLAVALDSHWNLELEGGFGARKSARAAVVWRY